MVEKIFLSQAIAKAWESQTFALPNPSVGALILSSDFKVLALESHFRFGSSHAELLAILEAFIALHFSYPYLQSSESSSISAFAPSSQVSKMEHCKFDSNAFDGVDFSALDLESRSALIASLRSLPPKELWEFLARNHRGIFRDCSLFVTLEPCLHEGKTPSCAKLIAQLGFKKVIIGAKDPTLIAGGGAQFLKDQGIEVVEGVCLEEAQALLYPFLIYQKKGRFNLFKIAQRLNGNYQNGQISNLASKRFTHTQRSNADSLILSGKTVRIDQPKLDTRFSILHHKTPKIQILTRTTAPTDSINAKDIRLCRSLDELELESGFNIIEGGYELLLTLRERMDCLLWIITPKIEGSGSEMILPKMDFELLHSQEFDDDSKDIALWLKPRI